MDNIAFHYQENPELKIEYKKIYSKPKSFYDEVLNTAKFIRNSTTKPIMLALSGGIDGEVAARGFLESGISIEVFSFQHKKNTNYHDIVYAKNFCEKYSIKHHIYPLDVDEFFIDGGFHKYVNDGYHATNIFRYLQLHILETITNMGYTAVLGGGEQIYRNIGGKPCIQFDQSFLNTLKWCEKNGTLHFPYFFHTRPELVISYIQDPLITFLASNTQYFDDGLNHSPFSIEKMLVYHRYFTGMLRRNKYSGFEKIKKERQILQQNLKKRFENLQSIYIPINDIIDCCYIS